jgi:hypothetical protein
LRTLRNFLVEIVHEHAHGGFLLPAFTGDLVAARGANGGWGLEDFRFNGHELMVIVGRGVFNPAGSIQQ